MTPPTVKIIVNRCFGGFGLSDDAYEWLIAKGIPVRKYVEQERGADGLYKKQPANDGRVIFDRTLSPPTLKTVSREDEIRFLGRYWETWIGRKNRTDHLLVECVEALGKKANGRHAQLEVVEIPAGMEWEIDEYDGSETIHEVHRSW